MAELSMLFDDVILGSLTVMILRTTVVDVKAETFKAFIFKTIKK